MTSATCKTCPFYGGGRDKFDGTCHRNPPVPLANVPYGADGEAEGVFPYVDPSGYCGEHPLLQRDRLAAMAMQGILTSDRDGGSAEKLADLAYAVADAMLAERSKK